MLRNKVLLMGVAFAMPAMMAMGCDDELTTTFDADASAVLAQYSDNVIEATYADLATNATALETAITTLQTTTNAANVNAARNAWIDARDAWERTETFLFGPVDTAGYDPRLDSWPVDVTQIEATIAGAGTIDVSAAADTERGFHTIEYLLHDDGAGATDAASVATALAGNARRMTYLAQAATDLRQTADALSTAWAAAGGNFGDQIKFAGSTSTNYPSQRAALEELIDGMITIVDEVGAGKIGGPYNANGGNGDVTDVESRFSRNSVEDFLDNIRGVESAYLGDTPGGTGPGLDGIVAGFNATLDTQIKAQITDAITKIGLIATNHGDFHSAIAARPTASQSVEDAIAALDTLRTTLETQLKPLIQSKSFGQAN